MSNYIISQKKDPYQDMNEISWAKKINTNGTQADKAYSSQYATPHYDNLRANGYGDIADFYKGANADTAYGYQKGYQKGAGENIYAKQYVDTNKYIADQRKFASDAADNAYLGQKAITDNQIQGVKAQYDDTNRRHYINYLKTKNALPQQLAALGYTGGLAETSALGLASEYMNNVADAEMQKNSEISGLNAKLLQAYYDKEAQKAQNEGQFAKMGLDQYNIDRDRAFSREQFEKQLDRSDYWNNREFDYKAGRDKVSDDFNNRQLAQQKELTEAELYNAIVLAQMKNKANGGSYTSTNPELDEWALAEFLEMLEGNNAPTQQPIGREGFLVGRGPLVGYDYVNKQQLPGYTSKVSKDTETFTEEWIKNLNNKQSPFSNGYAKIKLQGGE